MISVCVARYQYAKLRFVPDRAMTTLVVTPTRCHCSRAYGRVFKVAEVVCCDKLEQQLFLVCITTSVVYIFILT